MTVVYQVYPRSFQDSDGDGVGDLRGIAARLDHVASLGVDALWLSPIYPSPLADFGYDVSDFSAVDPVYGTLADFDALLAAAHERGLKLLMDLVPCHTSIEHPWFREHPDWYIWADGDEPPNNWIASFGGPAWTRDEQTGRWYLHSFYPEQPDLDWRNPEVVAAMQDVMRFWLDRGVDGFRLDAIDRLLKDPELRDDPPADEPFALPAARGLRQPRRTCTRATRRTSGRRSGRCARPRATRSWSGEVYLPDRRRGPLSRAPRRRVRVRVPPRAAGRGGAARARSRPARWRRRGRARLGRCPTTTSAAPATLSGPGHERAAALLLLTLPGTAFIYQGDEIGQVDGPGRDPPLDRVGRDAHRHPMQWDPSPARPASRPGSRGCRRWTRRAQRRRPERDRGSLLWLLPGPDRAAPRTARRARACSTPRPGTLAYVRGDEHLVALNSHRRAAARAGGRRPAPVHVGRARRRGAGGRSRPGEGFIARARA